MLFCCTVVLSCLLCLSVHYSHGMRLLCRCAALRRVDPAALASECQRKFACSTTVEDLPGKNNPGQAVILQVIWRYGGLFGACSVCACWVTRRRLTFVLCLLQGTWTEKLPDHLMKVHGIPKKYFLVKK